MELNSSAALLTAFVNLAVAVAILLRDRRRRVYVRFAAMAITLAIFYASTFFARALVVNGAEQVRFAAATLIPAMVFSVFMSLIATKKRVLMQRTVWALGFVIACLSLTPYFMQKWATALSITFAAVTLFVTFQIVWRQSRKATQKSEQVQLRSLAIGGAATSILGMGELASASNFFPAVGSLAVAVYMYFFYQTIISYRLIDVVELISKGAVLGALTVILGALFQLLLFWIGTGTGQFFFNTFIASFVILILYDQMRSWIEEQTIRVLFRERFIFKQAVQDLLIRLRSTIDVRSAIDLTLDSLVSSRKLTHVSLYLLREAELGFGLVAYRGPRPSGAINAESHAAFFSEIVRQKNPLLKEMVERKLIADPDSLQFPSEAERARASEVIATFNELGAQAVLPLLAGVEVIGLLCLGDTRVSTGFPADELALLYQVADQIAVSVENSEAFERLRERDRLAAIGEMSAGLAHEIRNPLGAIKGAVQVLDPQRFPEETRELMGVIVEEVERLNDVVSQFLAYAKPLKPSLVPTQVNTVIQRTVALFAEEQRCQSVEFKLHLLPDLPLIMSDADQLRQVLLNLLINAVEAFEGAPGKIEVSTRVVSSPRKLDHQVELRIRDHGPGIDAENMKRIFVPFFTTKAQGTGLGLAISQRIVNSHGGRISLQSRLAVGTTFILRFPMAKEG